MYCEPILQILSWIPAVVREFDFEPEELATALGVVSATSTAHASIASSGDPSAKGIDIGHLLIELASFCSYALECGVASEEEIKDVFSTIALDIAPSQARAILR